jgi:elongation factor G
MAQTTARHEVSTGDPALIRNVVLVGPSGSGKTTLIEQLLTVAGAIERVGSIDLGTTTCDFEEFEIQQKKSSSLAVASLTFGPLTINLIDTPGHLEFAGEVRAGLRAADAALFVVSVLDGVDHATTQLWEECATIEMPRAIVITHLDKRRGDFDDLVAICQRVFDEEIVPLHLPLLADNYAVAGLIDLLSQDIHDYSSGVRVIRPSDLEHGPLIESARNNLIEGIVAQSEDETLMDRYIAGESLDLSGLKTDLELAVARGHFYPVVGSSTTPSLFGARELLDLIGSGFPSPLEHPVPYVSATDGMPVDLLSCDPAGPLCAEVIKTVSHPYVGRISVIRVFSGSLVSAMPIHLSGHFTSEHVDHDVDERIGTISRIQGKALIPIERAIAGDVVAVSKLARAETGDTLSDPHQPFLIEPWLMPEPVLPVAIVASAKSDEDKLGSALARLANEDPTLRVEISDETQQWVLWSMGDAHLASVLDRLSTRYALSITTTPVRVALRETFASAATGHGRLAKQTGGHGQFAVCEITVEPLPRGSGYEFVDHVEGGAIPRNFISSVDTGIRQAMHHGLAAGFPVIDVRVTLTDGKAHPVDSSDHAFQQAGELALKDAAQSAGITLLEPVDTVTILTADEYVGALLSDVTSRRGRIASTTPQDGGQTEIIAFVPQMELGRYAIEVRALTHATATFTRSFCTFERVPSLIAQRIQTQNAST